MNANLSFSEKKAIHLKTLDAQIALSNRANRVAKVAEYQNQLNEYPNIVQISKQPTYAELFITEQNQVKPEEANNSSKVLISLANHLLGVADDVNTQYILDKLKTDLGNDDLNLLNSNWAGFEREVKKNFSKGIQKDIFIDYILRYVDDLKDGKESTFKLERQKQKAEIAEIESKTRASEKILSETELADEKLIELEGEIQRMTEALQNPKYVFTYTDDKLNAHNTNRPTERIKHHESYKLLKVIRKLEGELYKLKHPVEPFNPLTVMNMPEVEIQEGNGLNIKIPKTKPYKKAIRFMIGGSLNEIDPDAKYIKLNKYMVNMDDLINKNTLSVKYCKNRCIIANLKRQIVSENVKALLKKLLVDGDFDRAFFESKLSQKDKDLVIKFLNACHVDVGITFEDNNKTELMKQYEILVGQVENGNNSKEIRKSLKDVILVGISKKYIPKHQGLMMLDNLIA